MSNFPLTLTELEKVVAKFPTPFYLYDEGAMKKNFRHFVKAFSVFPSFKEHFAVKACPNPYILKVLAAMGAGADCSSMAELVLCEKVGITGDAIIFTSNETPAEEYKKASELGAIINLDDFTHIDYLEKALGALPKTLYFRYNPGSLKVGGNAFIGKPAEAKYGLTKAQILEAYKGAKARGVEHFGLHTMVASNELSEEFFADTAKLCFELCVEVQKECGVRIEAVDLGGGVGIPYREGEQPVDYELLAKKVKEQYDAILTPARLTPMAIKMECGRPITGPYGFLVARAIHEKHIYRDYIGLDASMADLMRPGMYGAYHKVIIAGKVGAPLTNTYDVVGSLCENCDKFAVQRALPKIDIGDFVIICDAGAHARAMGFNYNGKLRAGELLLREDGSIVQIRRRETLEDYFATVDFSGVEGFATGE